MRSNTFESRTYYEFVANRELATNSLQIENLNGPNWFKIKMSFKKFSNFVHTISRIQAYSEHKD